MAVYVDHAHIAYRRMRMSHMLADTLDELHAMADALGIARRHFQGAASWPHYDICESKRTRAIELGARPVTRRELRQLLQSWRAARALAE